jgi:hypothetical protein
MRAQQRLDDVDALLGGSRGHDLREEPRLGDQALEVQQLDAQVALRWRQRLRGSRAERCGE